MNTRRNRGFTLVELMISLVLGLVVIAAVVSMLLASKRSSRTTEGLSQIQESARTAYELLARDTREAGATGCEGGSNRVANVLNPPANWWGDTVGLVGYDNAQTDPAVAFGSAVGERVAGTDSVQFKGIRGIGITIVSHNPTSADFKISAATTEIQDGDIVMVCDFDHAAITQITNYNNAVNVVHNTGGTYTPGNCSKGLGFPTICTANGNGYEFGPNSQIAKVQAVDWYIGNNGRATEGGKSLFRRRLASGAQLVAGTTVNTEEIVAGVTDMQIRYRRAGTDTLVAASALTTAAQWDEVDAVAYTLTLDSADRNISTASATNSGRLQRQFTWIVSVRNRLR